LSLKKIYIDKLIADLDETMAIVAKIGLPATIADQAQQVFSYIRQTDDPIGKGKEVLYVTKNRGRFIKQCPGTRHYNCCGYQILNIGTFCHMDCAYCILQAYFHPPLLQYFINHNDMMVELSALFGNEQINRIGTGEFTDSLIWESWANLSAKLVPEFAKHSNSVLELKTKTTQIDGLNHLDHNRKTIMAWSLNTEKVIRNEEKGTASLQARLDAAKTCASWGYPLAFHFDPIIIYEGCEEDYRDVITQLFSTVPWEQIAWISLGTFRFMADLKSTIQKRFPSSKIIYGEFIPGLDQKMRYFKPIRIELYRKMVSWIRSSAPDVLIYFCMEDDEVWRKTLGFVPKDRGGLSSMLDESAVAHCALKKQTKYGEGQ
jgi:spore photoproduct lyase